MEIIMHENFIIVERYKSQHFVSFHFIFAVDYIRVKKALYGTVCTSIFLIFIGRV